MVSEAGKKGRLGNEGGKDEEEVREEGVGAVILFIGIKLNNGLRIVPLVLATWRGNAASFAVALPGLLDSTQQSCASAQP